MRERWKGHLVAVICILIWSSVIISTKVLLKQISPADILFWRFMIGYVVLWILYPHPMKLRDRKQELAFLVCGITGVNLYFSMQNMALQITRASDVSIIICIAPMLTALLRQVVHRKRELSVFFYIGFVIAITGVILVCSSSADQTVNFVGNLMTFIAAAGWAVYSVVGERIAREGYSLIPCVRRYFFYGILTMIPFLLTQEMAPISVIVRPQIIANLCYMGIAASGLAYVLWNYSAQKIGVVQTNIYLYLLPLVTITISAFVLDEKITVGIAIGAVLTVVGLILSEKESRK